MGLYLTSNKDQAIGMAYRKRAAADANVTGYMYRYLNGALGVPGSLAAREALLRAVKPDIYSRQICLHTQRAINCAVLVDRKTV